MKDSVTIAMNTAILGSSLSDFRPWKSLCPYPPKLIRATGAEKVCVAKKRVQHKFRKQKSFGSESKWLSLVEIWNELVG